MTPPTPPTPIAPGSDAPPGQRDWIDTAIEWTSGKTATAAPASPTLRMTARRDMRCPSPVARSGSRSRGLSSK